MNLDELKSTWQNLDFRYDRLEEDDRRTTDALAKGRAQNAQTKLARQYRINAYQGLIRPLLAPLIVGVLHLPMWLAIAYAAFGMLMSTLMFVNTYIVTRQNIIALPVVEALTETMKIRRRQNYTLIVGIVLGTVILTIFFFEIFGISNDSMLIGFFCGIAVGLPLGINKELKQRRLLREMEEALREVE